MHCLCFVLSALCPFCYKHATPCMPYHAFTGLARQHVHTTCFTFAVFAPHAPGTVTNIRIGVSKQRANGAKQASWCCVCQCLQILPDWMYTKYVQNFFISYRYPTGADKALTDVYRKKVRNLPPPADPCLLVQATGTHHLH